MPNTKNKPSAPAVKKVPFAVSEAYKSIRTNLISKLSKEQKKLSQFQVPMRPKANLLHL